MRIRSRLLRSVPLWLGLVSMGAAVPRTGGVVRIYLTGDESPRMWRAGWTEGLVRLATGAAIVPAAARSWRGGMGLPYGAPDLGAVEPALQWSFELDPLARFPDGSPVRPGDVIGCWESLLREEDSPTRWLLDPVVGLAAFVRREAEHVEGLAASAGELTVRLSRPTPDLLQRLAHPALAIRREESGGAPPEGTGPFRAGLVADRVGVNPYHRLGRPFLDGFELVPGGRGGSALWLALGEADLAIVYGRAASRLLEGGRGLRLERLPAWDRVYALWLNPQASGSDSPALRRSIARLIDREAMLRYLFDGRGEPAEGLLPQPPTSSSSGETAGGRPARGQPSLSLSFDDADPLAVAIAARLKARLEAGGLTLKLRPLPLARLRSGLRKGELGMALLLHHPPTHDPILALQDTLAPIGAGMDDAAEHLERGSRDASHELRWSGARSAESVLLADARLVPLVRLEAWLAMDERLVGVELGPAGVLGLDDAWWLP